jgi:predicted flap endonuclease-1-like 5' DNA nuclease
MLRRTILRRTRSGGFLQIKDDPMTRWMEDEELQAVRGDVEKAVGLSIGMASPLWLAFGAAASAGAAWWWMTRWARPVNLEAATALPASAAQPVAAPEPLAPAIETKAAPAATEAVQSVSAVSVDVPEPEAVAAEPAPEPAAPEEPDDLTRLFGVGPKLAKALAERGVIRFSQLAAWTAKDLNAIDADLKLLGRPMRDAWVEQARRLAAES